MKRVVRWQSYRMDVTTKERIKRKQTLKWILYQAKPKKIFCKFGRFAIKTKEKKTSDTVGKEKIKWKHLQEWCFKKN